jgi:hypothetical protein
MARGFLPPPTPGTSYPISASPAGDFAHEDDGLLTRIGANMGVAEAQTEGRVPSPLSRAYMFYTALFGQSLEMTGNADEDAALGGEGRRVLRDRARGAFRGLCAAFALRDALGLEIALRRIPLVHDADPIARVLVPTLNAAPGGVAFWQAVRLFTVRSRIEAGAAPEVLAGLSPLTAVFPAASPPQHSLAALFWFDAATGTWRDPTGPDPTGTGLALTPRTLGAVRGALKAWLGSVLPALPGSLSALGFDQKREDLLRQELQTWLQDLATEPPLPGVRVTQRPLDAPPGETVPPFLLAACEGVGAGLLSDLPLAHGRLVVSATGLRDRSRRIWGGLFGSVDLGALAEALPASGDNLGAALGLGADAAPVRFVAVDKLFTPRLTILTLRGISERWRALPVANGAATEHALFPFRPEILDLLTPDELAASVRAELSQDTLHYIVRLRFDGEEIPKLYATSGEGAFALDSVVAPDTLDLRLFPDFDLDAASDVLPAGGARYHARARLGPDWDFAVQALRLVEDADGRRRAEPFGAVARRGSTHPGPNGETPPGEAAFFALPDKPDAFSFGDRGLCLPALRPPHKAGTYAQTWEVAVDFGTSNTCVAYRVGDEQEARILDLPVLTTTLLRPPAYTALGPVNEGAAAAADFFYRMGEADRDLTSGPYFPTQVLTQQRQIPVGAPDGGIDLAAGLILFRTLSLGDGLRILEITEGFEMPQAGAPALQRRFRLEQDIKWSRREWLQTFMAHLRTQVLLTAADQNARVASVRFSYPKAFTRHEEVDFESVLRSVWGADVVQTPVSESEAVRHTLAGRANQHVVFDLGGGTTDIIGFNGPAPAFQTSVELAGRQIGQYVVGVPAFRQAFAGAVEAVNATDYAQTLRMLREGRTPAQVGNAWVGLLEAVERDDPSGFLLANILSTLKQRAASDDAHGRAVRGFFQTTALLFGGLAYFAGRLLGAASQGAFGAPFPLSEVSVTLTGNGSKLFRTLSSDRAPFGPVFESLVRSGLDGAALPAFIRFKGIYALDDGTPAPKTTVALGLLKSQGAAETPIPVANIIGEAVGDAPITADAVAFYSGAGRGAFVPSAAPPPELARFLRALGEQIPGGMLNGYDIIPGVGRAWADDLAALYPRAVGGLLERVQATAADLPADADAASVTSALEPLFIAELIALIDQIRLTNAA